MTLGQAKKSQLQDGDVREEGEPTEDTPRPRGAAQQGTVSDGGNLIGGSCLKKPFPVYQKGDGEHLSDNRGLKTDAIKSEKDGGTNGN